MVEMMKGGIEWKSRKLEMGCQGRFAPSERPKTRVTEIEEEVKEFEGEMKEKEEISNASWLTRRIGEIDGESGEGNAAG